jgi:translocation and assembly module TamA
MFLYYIFRSAYNPNQWVLMLCALLISSSMVFAEPDIRIDGGPDALRNNVRQYLSIAEETCSAPLWRLQSLLGDVSDEVKQAGQALGYYQLEFTSKLTQEKECWRLHLLLSPGEPAIVTDIQLIINGDGAEGDIFKALNQKELNKNTEINIGDRLDHGRYENLKNKIVALASSHGYYDGRFDTANIKVNIAENTASIVLIYDTGKRYRISEIRIKHDILSEELLRRYLNIQRGDYYDSEKLLELKNIYNSSNYFSAATASPDIQHLENYQVPIDVTLEERKRRTYSSGFGFATDTGPRVLLGYEDRYVNQRGHGVTADYTVSTIKTNAQLAYKIPMEQPFNEYMQLLTGYEKEETDTTYSNNRSIGASFTRFNKSQWLQTYALSLEKESSRVNESDTIYTFLVLPSASILRTKTDGSPYPLSGWSLLSTLSGSPKTFGSDLSFIKWDTRAKYIYGLPQGRLLLRTELGLSKVNDIKKLPISKRYFAGGDTSVRGYDYQSLGPSIKLDETGKETEDETGKKTVIGGNNLWVSSIEYDYLVKSRWALAAFYDVGNAVDDFHTDLKRSVGVGIRWISPIGPVRLDFAKALDDAKGWKVHLTLGPDL